MKEAPKDDSLYTLLARCQLAAGDVAAASKTKERLMQNGDGTAARQLAAETMQAEIDLAHLERADDKNSEERAKLVASTEENVRS